MATRDSTVAGWALEALQSIREDSGAIAIRAPDVEVTEEVAALQKELLALRGELLRAREAERVRSEFLAAMSHELRTPLNAVMGYADLILEEAEEGSASPEIVKDVRQIQIAANYLLTLVTDILDLSRIEAGKMPVFVEPVRISELFEALRGTMTPAIERHANRLVFEVDEGVEVIHTDVIKARQILINLLSNAAKFTRAGTIEVHLSVEGAGVDAVYTFVVSDEGVGIDNEKLETIFAAFEQAEVTTAREFGGTGLGLTICRHFAELLGGRIEVQSALGVGSRFIVRLPVRGAVIEPGASGRVRENKAKTRGCVLVIDDDPSVHDLVRRYLEPEGFELVSAHSGVEGIALAASAKPDVIVLDVVMPGLSGWSVLSLLKEDDALASIPVVLLTVVTDFARGYSLGASDYLVKPVDRGRLLQVLKRYDVSEYEVLFVEPDAEIAGRFSRAGVQQGVIVRDVASGDEAAARMRGEARVDAILLNLVGGVEAHHLVLVEALRGSERGQKPPVVVMTEQQVKEWDAWFLDESVGIARVLLQALDSPDDVVREIKSLVRSRQEAQVKKDAP